MILVDSNVLIALVDERDHLHGRAAKDAEHLSRRELLLIPPVLTESCFALPMAYQRRRLHRLITGLRMSCPPACCDTSLWTDAMDWMERYVDQKTTARLLAQANSAIQSGVEVEVRGYAMA